MSSITQFESDRINGVDTGRIVELATFMSEDDNFGQFRFKAQNLWINGSQSQSHFQSFYAGNQQQTERTTPLTVLADLPGFLGGTNSAPNAVEHYLHALTSCLNTTIIAHASVQGNTVASLVITAEGEMDARGFFGIKEDTDRGYRLIRVNISTKTNMDEESFKELLNFSPVYEMVRKAIPVEVILNIEPQD